MPPLGSSTYQHPGSSEQVKGVPIVSEDGDGRAAESNRDGNVAKVDAKQTEDLASRSAAGVDDAAAALV